ncbi:carbohydrate ABC transporter permease [Dactylosporangium darangshiense]|uniref:Carbohydrate ABC transporter permease n=1 Tax=Dactylosporangium darangshiense TaxID=579108 RepID=A0ABP8CUA1_9ACTN
MSVIRLFPAHRRSAAPGRRRAGASTYLLLGAIVAVSVFPLYWSLVASSQDNSAVGSWPPKLLPGTHLLANLQQAFSQGVFGLALLNSTIVASTVTVSVVLTSTLAGFAFAKLRFRGSNAMLTFVVMTMMVPAQLGIIPLYIMMSQWLGWTGQLQAVIVPAATSAFGVFLMRQYLAEALPNELLEAGRVDGCSTTQLYWHVVLPAARPAAAVLALFTFMGAWNDFFWPLLALGQSNPTVQVALSTLAGGYYMNYSLVLAGTLISTAPILLVFAVLGKQIIGGIMQGAVKA